MPSEFDILRIRIEELIADLGVPEDLKAGHLHALYDEASELYPDEFQRWQSQLKKKLSVDDLFVQKFCNYSINNRLYARAVFHVIFGQLCVMNPATKFITYEGGSKLDLRTHLFLLMPLRSGKGKPLPYIKNVCVALGLKVKELTSYSAEALIGRIDEDVDPKTGKRVVRTKHGVIDPHLGYNLVVMKEGKGIINAKSKEYTADAPRYICEACDPIGDNTVSKDQVGKDTLEIVPTCSFLFMTFPPEQLTDFILDSGVLQRFITMIPDKSFDSRISDIKNYQIRAIGVGSNEDVRKHEYPIDEIVSELKTIQSHYISNRIQGIKPEATAELNRITDLCAAKVRHMDKHRQDIILGFITGDVLIVLATHYCMCRRGEFVLASDVSKAYSGFYEHVFDWLLEWVDKHITPKSSKQFVRDTQKLLELYNNHRCTFLSDYYKLVCRTLGCSLPTARKLTKKSRLFTLEYSKDDSRKKVMKLRK